MESGGLITAEEARAPRADPGESGAARRIEGDQHAVCRRADDPAGRSRARAPACRRRRSASCSTARAPIRRSRARRPFMSPGDFVITGNWAPHDHGNTSNKPMLWLDVLDLPTVNFFETSFADYFDEARCRTRSRQDGDSLAFYGSGVLPDGTAIEPEAQPGDQLHLCAHAPDPRAHDEGRRHRQAPRRARALRQPDHRRLGAADHGRATSRCSRRASRARNIAATDGTIFVCAEGQRHHHGRRQGARVGRRTTCSSCRRGSIMRTTRTKESVLFSISDRPAQEALGIWREDKVAA